MAVFLLPKFYYKVLDLRIFNNGYYNRLLQGGIILCRTEYLPTSVPCRATSACR